MVVVAVGITEPEVLKAQVPQKCASVFTGSAPAYFRRLAEHFTSPGDWILELNPINGKP